MDSIKPDLEKQVVEQQRCHDQHAKERTTIVGDTVFAKNLRDGPTWVPAVVVAQTGAVSYKVKLDSGAIWRRHVDQLHNRHVDTDFNVESREDVGQEDTLIPVLPESDVSIEDAAARPEPLLEDSSAPTGASGPTTLSTTAPRRNPPRDWRPPDRYKL